MNEWIGLHEIDVIKMLRKKYAAPKMNFRSLLNHLPEQISSTPSLRNAWYFLALNIRLRKHGPNVPRNWRKLFPPACRRHQVPVLLHLVSRHQSLASRNATRILFQKCTTGYRIFCIHINPVHGYLITSR